MPVMTGDPIVGITPARAGRTFAVYGCQKSFRDHPRSRGKDLHLHRMILKILGSPPLAREGHGDDALEIEFNRITPARAGRTVFCEYKNDCYWDHPRSRGKDHLQSVVQVGRLGSPPLAREGLYYTSCIFNSCRITPARAGRTEA